jgi:hypothetical protein
MVVVVLMLVVMLAVMTVVVIVVKLWDVGGDLWYGWCWLYLVKWYENGSCTDADGNVSNR